MGVISTQLPWLILIGPSWIICQSGTNHVTRRMDYTDWPDVGQVTQPSLTTISASAPLPKPRALAKWWAMPCSRPRLGPCPHCPLLLGILRYHEAQFRYHLIEEAFCDPPGPKCHLFSLSSEFLLPFIGPSMTTPLLQHFIVSWACLVSLTDSLRAGTLSYRMNE